MWQQRLQRGRNAVNERGRGGSLIRLSIVSLLPIFVACDPILDIDGAFFPGWMLCIIIGIALAFAAHPVFVRLGIAEYIGPPVLIYPCLALLLTLAAWLVLFPT